MGSVKHRIAFMAPVESVSRKFVPREETCANKLSTGKIQHKWLGAGVRYMATKDLMPHNMNYFVVRKNARLSDYSDNEILARGKFATVRAAVAARMRNLSTIAADQAAFKAQRDLPNGRKSFYSYIWKVEVEAYDQQHPHS